MDNVSVVREKFITLCDVLGVSYDINTVNSLPTCCLLFDYFLERILLTIGGK